MAGSSAAFKVVLPDFRSYIDGPAKEIYMPGSTVETAHPVGLWACTTREVALARVKRFHRRQHVLVVELAYAEQDVVAEDRGVIRLSRCRVVRVVADAEPIILAKWPTLPGATLDLGPVVAEIEPMPFLARTHWIPHARRTAEIAARLIADVPDADPDVVAAFAILHDSKRQREHERVPGEDGPVAAAFARDLHERGVLALTDTQLELLCDALANDYPPTTSEDPTVGLCWDACRLASVVLIPRRFMSTDVARSWPKRPNPG